MKQCRSCGVEKPLSEFYKKGNGVTSKCICCTKAYHKTEEHRAYQRRYQKLNKTPEQTMLARSKSRARKKGFEHNIDLSDIHIPEKCPLLDIPLTVADNCASDNSPSLDRIDPNKGYVKGNVWVISNKANSIKNNATSEELLLIATRLTDFIENGLQNVPTSPVGTA